MMSADVAATAAAGQKIQTGQTASDRQQQAKLVDAAQQFEAMMLGEMLKPLHFGEAAGAGDSGDSSSESSGESSGGANDTIRSMGIEALTKGLAKSGGFGMAQKIVRQVHAEHERSLDRSGGSSHTTKVS